VINKLLSGLAQWLHRTIVQAGILYEMRTVDFLRRGQMLTEPRMPMWQIRSQAGQDGPQDDLQLVAASEF
jgi:hypothetical protein